MLEVHEFVNRSNPPQPLKNKSWDKAFLAFVYLSLPLSQPSPEHVGLQWTVAHIPDRITQGELNKGLSVEVETQGVEGITDLAE